MKKGLVVLAIASILSACGFQNVNEVVDELSLNEKERVVKRYALNNSKYASVLSYKYRQNDNSLPPNIIESMYDMIESYESEQFESTFNSYMFNEHGANMFIKRNEIQGLDQGVVARYTFYDQFYIDINKGTSLFDGIPLNIEIYRHEEFVPKRICNDGQEIGVFTGEMLVNSQEEKNKSGAELLEEKRGGEVIGFRVLMNNTDSRLLVIQNCPSQKTED